MWILALLLLSNAGTQTSCLHEGGDVPELNMLATPNDWMSVFCSVYASDFESIHATVLTKTTSHSLEQGDSKAKGLWVVSPINMGRVQMKWTAKEQPGNALTLWLKVDGFKHVNVFARDLNNEAIIGDDDTTMASINLAQQLREGREVSVSPAGHSVTRSVRKGEPIFSELLRPAPLVARNEPVNIVLEANNLLIRTKGIALNTGWHIEDRVQVKVEGAEAAVSAKVKAENLVYVMH